MTARIRILPDPRATDARPLALDEPCPRCRHLVGNCQCDVHAVYGPTSARLRAWESFYDDDTSTWHTAADDQAKSWAAFVAGWEAAVVEFGEHPEDLGVQS